MKNLKTIHIRLVLLAFALLGLRGIAQGQAPDGLSDTIIAFNVYSVFGDHQDNLYHRWLRGDGTYVDITNQNIPRPGLDNGPIGLITGKWTYGKSGLTSGRILFYDKNSSGSPASFSLEFTNARSGLITRLRDDNIPDGANGYGKFTLRPAQPLLGPVNVSSRTFLTANGATIAGFIISGTESRFVLFRAIGPGLAPFGVDNTASNMGLTVYGSTGVLGTGIDWFKDVGTSALYQNLFALAGAFPLASSGDVCLILELPPGSYTAQMTSVVGGNALIEVYFLP